MRLSSVGHLHDQGVSAGLLALLLPLLAMGCSQTRTVTVPAAESTITAEVPDTSTATLLPEEPPAPITRPEEVIVYADTPDYTVDLSMVEVDRTDPDNQTVTVRTQVGEQTIQETLQLPTVGEALRGTADNSGLQWGVPGSPEEWTSDAYVRDEPPWWTRLWTQVRLALAFLGGVAFGYVVTKLVPGV